MNKKPKSNTQTETIAPEESYIDEYIPEIDSDFYGDQSAYDFFEALVFNGPEGGTEPVQIYADKGDGALFSHLLASDGECPECGYEGALKPKRKGYFCPECKSLVIPAEG